MALRNRRLLMSACLLAGGWSSVALSADNNAVRQVTTRPLSAVVIQPRSSAPALVLSLNESRVSAQIAAAVSHIPVRVGDRVNKGQPLVTLACGDFRLRQSQAEAALATAKARQELAASQVQRAEPLASEGNFSQELMQQRQSDLKIAAGEGAAAEANLHAAELNVQRCSVTAPFAGVVLARLVSEGEWVAAGTAVVTLLDSQRLELSAQIGVDEVKGLRQARLLEFVADGQRYPVTLRAMPERIDPQLRQREARLSFSGKGALPGQSGRLEWQSGVAHLPADLPVRRYGRLGLFVVEQGKARFVVLPDAIEGRPVSAAALPAKAVVVIEGRQSLRDGDAVTVVQSR